jgi:ankyrin repeat protein
VKLLLESHAAVDSLDVFGQTPLSIAAKNEHQGVVKLLQGEILDATEDGQHTGLKSYKIPVGPTRPTQSPELSISRELPIKARNNGCECSLIG